MRVANAPCSWGALEFDLPSPPASASQVLDEAAATGDTGTDLGDWGLLTLGGGDPVSAVTAYGARIWHVHFKDCDPAVLNRARTRAWDYHATGANGIFCEFGCGCVRFPDVHAAPVHQNYAGWIVVEQDVRPGLGTAAAGARRNRAYLEHLGLRNPGVRAD